tara:strand:- start:5035 stop:5484 length:450 start_codon:yes stop_codon:yes gene_type:complete
MPFHTDKQRKAVMAKLSRGKSRSDTSPTVIGRLRKRFRPTPKELRKQRGLRIKKEAEELRKQRLRTQQLELEAKVEAERESLKAREERARARLKQIDKTRREATFAGKIMRAEKKLITRGVKAVLTPRPRPKRRRKAPAPAPEQEFFRI